jgi:hypothetical protein
MFAGVRLGGGKAWKKIGATYSWGFGDEDIKVKIKIKNKSKTKGETELWRNIL